jgi:hypothetical protein
MSKLTIKKQKIYWRITVAAAVVLIVITFTPLVLSEGKIEPKLFSMPYTLWISILITILLVVLTYIGGRIHLKDKENK